MMRVLMVGCFALAAVLFAACGDDDNAKTVTPSAAHPASATVTVKPTAGPTATLGGSPAGEPPFVVNAILRDYELVRNPGSGAAGPVQFQINNSGPSVHEFVVVKTDLAADQLPTDSDGAVKEDDSSLQKIGAAEDIEVGGQTSFTASLDPGHYVFFCNRLEQGGGGAIAHYTQGMHRDFTVQ